MNRRGSETCEGVEAIVRIEPADLQPYVPPLTDYQSPSAGWCEAEYRCFIAEPRGKATVGYWTGEPGEVSFDAWPYIEICSILSGQVGLRDTGGRVVRFGAGEGFVVPKGWRGSWLTLQPSTKIFIAIE